MMEKIHSLKFPETEALGEKKAVPCLYIDADEDHVALQYLEKKGDVRKRDRGNTVMPNIVCVYESITGENRRNELIETRHFGGVYEGAAGNERLWREVKEYIEGSYGMECLKQIYISGDGAARMRIYRANGGDMLELVRYQKKEKAAGTEEIVYSIPYTQIKKIASLKNHIWGL